MFYSFKQNCLNLLDKFTKIDNVLIYLLRSSLTLVLARYQLYKIFSNISKQYSHDQLTAYSIITGYNFMT